MKKQNATILLGSALLLGGTAWALDPGTVPLRNLPIEVVKKPIPSSKGTSSSKPKSTKAMPHSSTADKKAIPAYKLPAATVSKALPTTKTEHPKKTAKSNRATLEHPTATLGKELPLPKAGSRKTPGENWSSALKMPRSTLGNTVPSTKTYRLKVPGKGGAPALKLPASTLSRTTSGSTRTIEGNDKPQSGGLPLPTGRDLESRQLRADKVGKPDIRRTRPSPGTGTTGYATDVILPILGGGNRPHSAAVRATPAPSSSNGTTGSAPAGTDSSGRQRGSGARVTATPAPPAPFTQVTLRIQLDRLRVIDDGDNVSPGDWFLGMAAYAHPRDIFELTDIDVATASWPSSGATNVDSGHTYRPELEMFLRDVSTDQWLTLSFVAVDCDSDGPFNILSLNPPLLRPVGEALETILGAGHRCSGQEELWEVSGHHDRGSKTIEIPPQDWRRGRNFEYEISGDDGMRYRVAGRIQVIR